MITLDCPAPQKYHEATPAPFERQKGKVKVPVQEAPLIHKAGFDHCRHVIGISVQK
jgi:hypothetical protein